MMEGRDGTGGEKPSSSRSDLLQQRAGSYEFFDTDGNIDDEQPFDYFDAVEVLYFDDMMHEKMLSLKRASAKVRVGERQRKLRQLAAKKRAQLEERIHYRRKKIREKMRQPGFVMTVDKVSFVTGILIMMATEGVLLMTPGEMGRFYTALLIPLMTARYYLYRKDEYHYFMYDFCYFSQVVLLLNMYRWPQSEVLVKINFSISNGPLAIAILMWRNSLVFHSLDKMTSCYIHILPALVTFSMRWEVPLVQRNFVVWESTSSTLPLMVRDFGINPFLCYLLWQVLYLIKTEVISRQKLAQNTEIMTALRWYTRKPGSASHKILSLFGEGEKRQLATFVLVQGLYTIITFLPIPLLWHSIYVHAFYLAIIFIAALTNGAAYYFHVFAVRYIDMLEKRKEAPPADIVKNGGVKVEGG